MFQIRKTSVIKTPGEQNSNTFQVYTIETGWYFFNNTWPWPEIINHSDVDILFDIKQRVIYIWVIVQCVKLVDLSLLYYFFHSWTDWLRRKVYLTICSVRLRTVSVIMSRYTICITVQTRHTICCEECGGGFAFTSSWYTSSSSVLSAMSAAVIPC